ncbi:hypothetical protein [Haladaptatus salinisoli]|nr:hypothetical protein [Haladaptatus salinisoli]
MYENYDDATEFHIDRDDYEPSPSGGYKLVYHIMLGREVAQ